MSYTPMWAENIDFSNQLHVAAYQKITMEIGFIVT